MILERSVKDSLGSIHACCQFLGNLLVFLLILSQFQLEDVFQHWWRGWPA